MTERLTELLNHEADVLEIPAPPAADVLGRGRSVRRRRRLTGLVAAAAVLGVIGGGAALVLDNTDHGTKEAVATSPVQRYLSGGAYAVGSTVHFGDPATTDPVTLDARIKSLYYTASGVVVRSGNEPFTDDAGPSRYALVTPKGEVRDLGLDLGDRVPDTDPESSTFVYADGSPDHWEVVVFDVASNKETKRIPIDGEFTWGGWEAPPVGLSGHTAYVGMDDATLAVDLDTGRTSTADSIDAPTAPATAGGRASISMPSGDVDVVDLTTGDTVLHVDLPDGYSYGSLSPDGRFLKVVQEESIDENGDIRTQDAGFAVYDVATGEHVTFEDQAWDYGWAPDGHLLKVDRERVTLCEATTGECSSAGAPGGKGMIKIAGMSYES